MSDERRDSQLTKKLKELEEKVDRVVPFLTDLYGPGKENVASLQALSAETGESVGRLLFKALSFYRKGLAAEKVGNSVAILDPDLNVVEELEGFGPERSRRDVRPISAE